jgi:hypothetical protein
VSNRALAALAIRLMGIYAWFQVLTVAPTMGYLFVGESLRHDEKGLWMAMVAISFVALALWIALGFLMILMADRIALRMAPPGEGPRPEPADPGSLQAVFFSVVGLILVVHSIPKLIETLVSLKVAGSGAFLFPPWISVLLVALEFVMGVALFVGARGLSRVWRRIGEMNRMP